MCKLNCGNSQVNLRSPRRGSRRLVATGAEYGDNIGSGGRSGDAGGLVGKDDDARPERLYACQAEGRRCALSEEPSPVTDEHGVDRKLKFVKEVVLEERRSERAVSVEDQLVSVVLFHSSDFGGTSPLTIVQLLRRCRPAGSARERRRSASK
jgi:hypothetical protein